MSKKVKIKPIREVYEVTSGEVKLYIHLHDGYIEIVDDDLDPKAFTFASKDTPERRKKWLEVLKTIETAIKLIPAK